MQVDEDPERTQDRKTYTLGRPFGLLSAGVGGTTDYAFEHPEGV